MSELVPKNISHHRIFCRPDESSIETDLKVGCVEMSPFFSLEHNNMNRIEVIFPEESGSSNSYIALLENLSEHLFCFLDKRESRGVVNNHSETDSKIICVFGLQPSHVFSTIYQKKKMPEGQNALLTWLNRPCYKINSPHHMKEGGCLIW